MTTMSRPITLLAGQWADLPFEEVAKLAAEWGYDGLEIACSGDHLDVVPGAVDDDYVASRRQILNRYGLQVFAISAHLIRPASAVEPAQGRPTGRVGIPAGRRESWWCGHVCRGYETIGGPSATVDLSLHTLTAAGAPRKETNDGGVRRRP